MPVHSLAVEEPFLLESGDRLPRLDIVYHTYGENDGRPVVWICHALTANSDPCEWWPGMVGEDCPFDPNRHFIICANMLGSCYGTTCPLHENPITGEAYFHDFPPITIRDMARAHETLRKRIGIERVDLLIGGSMGGQQALEWSIMQPERFERLVLVAVNAKHSPWGIAFNESQRMAIEADPTWQTRSPQAGANGLKAARAVAMLSYRGPQTYNDGQAESSDELPELFRAASYQRYQGQKLVDRFNAYSYYALSKSMDSHNVGRGRESIAAALAKVQAETLVLGLSTDLLFPPAEQRFLSERIAGAKYIEVESAYAHDGFLVEVEKIGREVRRFFGQEKLAKSNEQKRA